MVGPYTSALTGALLDSLCHNSSLLDRLERCGIPANRANHRLSGNATTASVTKVEKGTNGNLETFPRLVGTREPPDFNGNSNSSQPSVSADTQRRLEAIRQTIFQPESGPKLADIVGLQDAKAVLSEAIILPMKMPHLFSGADGFYYDHLLVSLQCIAAPSKIIHSRRSHCGVSPSFSKIMQGRDSHGNVFYCLALRVLARRLWQEVTIEIVWKLDANITCTCHMLLIVRGIFNISRASRGLGD